MYQEASPLRCRLALERKGWVLTRNWKNMRLGREIARDRFWTFDWWEGAQQPRHSFLDTICCGENQAAANAMFSLTFFSAS